MGRQIVNTASEYPLLAVVIADSFDEKFMPLTRDIPRCLLPLQNVPLIDYTLDFLASNRIEAVYLVCKSNADKIEEYINKKSKWARYPFMKVKLVISQSLSNLGDALRELDSMNVIQSDFVLVTGDVISNVKLQPIIEEHRRRRMSQDPKCILTIMFRAFCAGHRTRSRCSGSLFVMDSATNRCLHWCDVSPYPRKVFAEIDKKKLNGISEAEIYSNIIDCGIDICSPEILLCFSDNFDWDRMRSDLVRGLLESELNEWSIYCHILKEEYAVAVVDPHVYDSVSKDIISCWAFPYVLDSNLHPGFTFKMHKPGVYMEKNVNLDMTTILENNISLASGTVVGENTVIRDSVIGRNCTIGANCKLLNSYMFENTKIEDNCVVSGSIIGYNCVIRSGEKLASGTILSSNTTYEIGVTDPSRYRLPQSFNEFKKRFSPDDKSNVRNLYINTIGNVTYPPYTPEEEEIVSDSESFVSEEEPCKEDFYAEVQQTLDRSLDMGHTVSDTALELSTLKLGMDRSLQDLRVLTFKYFLSRMGEEAPLKNLTEIMKKWGPLLTKITHTNDDYLDILDVFEEFVTCNPSVFMGISSQLLYILYDCDIIDEDSIRVWHENLLEDEESPNEQFWNEIKKFINWLDTAEETSSTNETGSGSDNAD